MKTLDNKLLDKETTRRHLLANMLNSANGTALKSSPGRWISFWQGLFKSPRSN